MVPSTNTTCESDFQLVAPRGITIHSHRLWITNHEDDEAGIERMNGEIESAARYLATANVDVIAYGCTTGSFYKGPGWDQEMIDLIESNAGVPAVATSPSAVEALRFLGAMKISMATPYPKWSNERLRVYMEDQGFEVLNVAGEPWASQAGAQGINDQEPEAIVEFASEVCLPEADVLFCSCTAWRSLEIVDKLEERTGKLVVTSNQATIWATLAKLGISQPIQGFGKLLGAKRDPHPSGI